MAILNLTEAEWAALVEAAVFQDTHWEQDGDKWGNLGAVAPKRRSLHRAMRKVGQLAPEGTFRWSEDS